jgi:hypothetical protein
MNRNPQSDVLLTHEYQSVGGQIRTPTCAQHLDNVMTGKRTPSPAVSDVAPYGAAQRTRFQGATVSGSEQSPVFHQSFEGTTRRIPSPAFSDLAKYEADTLTTPKYNRRHGSDNATAGSNSQRMAPYRDQLYREDIQPARNSTATAQLNNASVRNTPPNLEDRRQVNNNATAVSFT